MTAPTFFRAELLAPIAAAAGIPIDEVRAIRVEFGTTAHIVFEVESTATLGEHQDVLVVGEVWLPVKWDMPTEPTS